MEIMEELKLCGSAIYIFSESQSLNLHEMLVGDCDNVYKIQYVDMF